MQLKEVFDIAILGVLVLLSVIVVALIFERLIAFKRVQVEAFGDKKELEIELTKYLTLIATIGANAPYIGLLGTVGGIMLTFVEISQTQSPSTQSIMSGLALALKATGMGLIVAIPAIVAYNLLLRKVEVLLLKWDIAHKRGDYVI